MPAHDPLREHLVQLLEGGNAHAKLDQAVRGFPVARAGERPQGAPYSAWELLEHMRIAQNDILRFCQSADYQSPEWPAGYWPRSPAPESESQWRDAIAAFRRDLDEFLGMVNNPKADLYAKIQWGDGQTLLREALLIADHNAYHLGQLILVRRLLGAWKQ